jgi:hypothetical protein
MFLLRTIFIILLGLHCVEASPPPWYLKSSDNNFEVTGYGQAPTVSEAKEMALKDIAQTLKVEISSSTDIRKTLDNNKFNTKVTQNLSTSASAVLIGTHVKATHHNNDIWYVSVVYDTSSLAEKFKRALKNQTLKNEEKNYLSSTELINEINQALGYKLRYKIFRENNLWMIQYDNNKFVINEQEFRKLFKFKRGTNINVKLNKKIFYPGDKMKFRIKAQDSGYVSMLYAENDGKVGVLYTNIKSKRVIHYPPENSNEELVISNPLNRVLEEMYLAIWSKNRIDLTAFEDVQNNHLDDSNYKFSELIRLLDKSDYSSVVVKIKF